VRRIERGNLLGRAGGHQAPALLPALRPEVDHPVGRLDDVQVVLDDEQRVPRLQQLAEGREQLRDVVEVQPGRRLVENVEHAVAGLRREVRGNLDPLRLAARQRRRRLPEAEVAEADLVEHLEPPQHLGRAAEEGQRLAHRHARAPGRCCARGTSPRAPAA
jgi:hypothetical protein